MSRRKVTLPDLFATLRSWVADVYPGARVDEVVLLLRTPDGPRRVRLPIPNIATADDAGEIARPCARAILDTLREVGHRLTTTPLLREMESRGHEWSERKISGELARLVEDGTLTNRQDSRPAGYGLPEWESGPHDRGGPDT